MNGMTRQSERATLIIRNIGQLLTMTGPQAPGIVEDAVVVIRDGRIAAFGPASELVGEFAGFDGAGSETADAGICARILDAGGGVLAPGLVDPHTHLLFAGWREAEFAQRIEGASYLEILASGGGILSTVERFRAAGDEELLDWGRTALDRMLLSGTTTVEAKTGYGLTTDDELRALALLRRLDEEHPVTVIPTFLGAHAVPAEYRSRPDGASAYLEEVCLPLLPRIAEEGLAAFCDIFCEKGVFDADQARRVLTEAGRLGLGAKIHADEIESMGGAELAAEVGAISADHLVRVSDRGIEMMAREGVVGVVLPATTFTLGSPDYAPARRMLEAGVEVALATDFNPGTSPVESMPLVMGIACRAMKLTPAEAFRASTAGAARAVGLGGCAGTVETGRPADLVVFDTGDYRQVPYRLGVNLVHTVIKDGKVVVSDRELVYRRKQGGTP